MKCVKFCFREEKEKKISRRGRLGLWRAGEQFAHADDAQRLVRVAQVGNGGWEPAGAIDCRRDTRSGKILDAHWTRGEMRTLEDVGDGRMLRIIRQRAHDETAHVSCSANEPACKNRSGHSVY